MKGCFKWWLMFMLLFISNYELIEGYFKEIVSVRDFDRVAKQEPLSVILISSKNTKNEVVKQFKLLSRQRPWSALTFALASREKGTLERIALRYSIKDDALIVFKDGSRIATKHNPHFDSQETIEYFLKKNNVDQALEELRQAKRIERRKASGRRLFIEPSAAVVFGGGFYPDYTYPGAGDYYGPRYYSYERPGYVHFGIGFGF